MEKIKWTPELEVSLFRAMQDHKPVGIHKHWHILCIHNRMLNHGGVTITVPALRKHLGTMYDLHSLDELENNLLPLIMDFQLPANLTTTPKQDESAESDVSIVGKRPRASNSPSSPSESPPRTKRKRIH